MAECTNTAEFLAEWARMHDAQQRDEHGFPKETCTDDNCIGCPLDIGLDCKEFAFRNINHAINKVQKWSDAHPLPKPKTYADVFCEAFPKCDKDALYLITRKRIKITIRRVKPICNSLARAFISSKVIWKPPPTYVLSTSVYHIPRQSRHLKE